MDGWTDEERSDGGIKGWSDGQTHGSLDGRSQCCAGKQGTISCPGKSPALRTAGTSVNADVQEKHTTGSRVLNELAQPAVARQERTGGQMTEGWVVGTVVVAENGRVTGLQIIWGDGRRMGGWREGRWRCKHMTGISSTDM